MKRIELLFTLYGRSNVHCCHQKQAFDGGEQTHRYCAILNVATKIKTF